MEKVKTDFTQVGHDFKIVAIMTIFETFMVIPVFNLVSLIFIIKALNSLTSANNSIQSQDLSVYISKFKTTTILRFIASLLLVPVSVIPSIDIDTFRWITFIPTIAIFSTFLIMRIIAGVIEREAWKRFNQFSITELKKYPFLTTGQDASEKLDNAALCEILSFLIVPIFIGWIYRLIGYFKLADFEDIPAKKGEEQPKSEPVQTATQRTGKSSVTEEITQEKGLFCPYCGEKIRKGAKFCGSCGSSLTQKKKD
jgi:uncharacterized membrane protein